MKKAISVLLSWVLIVGFAVAMSAIIFGWAIPFVEKIVKNLDRSESPEIYCDNTALKLNDFGICRVNDEKLKIQLLNSGSYNIKRLTIARETSANSLQSCFRYNLEDTVNPNGPPEPGKIMNLELAMKAAFEDAEGNSIDCPSTDFGGPILGPCTLAQPNDCVTLIEVTPWINVEGKDIACPNSRLTIKNINMLNFQCS